jgi:hypothetical protein
MREYRTRKASDNFEPRRRGRKPVDYGLLNVWEFEWYKAFHLLRDGAQLRPEPVAVRVNRREAQAQLRWWKSAAPREILGDMRLEGEPGRDKPITKVDLQYAEFEREGEIAALERHLNPRAIREDKARRAAWDALIAADTVAAVERACKAWVKVLGWRARGFADHVEVNAGELIRIKRDPRFPRSRYADEERLEHLARGMAGVMTGVSPLTAIARLRTMSHARGGPLWKEYTLYADDRPDNKMVRECGCWRCRLNRWQGYYRQLENSQLERGARP